MWHQSQSGRHLFHDLRFNLQFYFYVQVKTSEKLNAGLLLNTSFNWLETINCPFLISSQRNSINRTESFPLVPFLSYIIVSLFRSEYEILSKFRVIQFHSRIFILQSTI